MEKDIKAKFEAVKARFLSVAKVMPKMALTLGSGLGDIVDQMEVECEIPFEELGVKASSVAGHRGSFVFANFKGTRIVCMRGRLHFYEGHAMSDVVFPFRLLAYAGVESFILTNAAGTVHETKTPPYLLLIRDHINFMGSSPLVGPNLSFLGPRFPDMTEIYDVKFSDYILKKAAQLKIDLSEGVYAATHGPNYETPSEVKMYRTLGADVVGMSTVPEVIALRHMGKRVLGISSVTNFASGVQSKENLSHEEVLQNGKKIQPKLLILLEQAVAFKG